MQSKTYHFSSNVTVIVLRILMNGMIELIEFRFMNGDWENKIPGYGLSTGT